MRQIRTILRWVAYRFPRVFRWVVRHPLWAGVVTVAVVVAVIAVSILVPPLLARCGPGMSEDANGACVGIDLASTPFTSTEPATMRSLESQVRANNDAVSQHASQNYVSIVLLLDMSPVAGVDTRDYPDLYPDIEGALTGVWRANHTATVGSLPKVKLFLASMGSQYAGWSDAARRITANAVANHIVSVIGLGQSTDNTRAAAAALTGPADGPSLPVIGATVTGDLMNLGLDGRLNTGFFRTSPTNTYTVRAAARYIASIEPDSSRVAIVQDNTEGDDYTHSLGAAVDRDMPTAHRFPFTSPTNLPPNVVRNEPLVTQFFYLDQNICSVAPTVLYFAGRGADLGPFVQTWTQGDTPCANRALTVVTGNDGGAAIKELSLLQALRGGHVRVVFTSPASPDEWGTPCNGSDVQVAYYTFQAVFTGLPDPCTGQPVQADDGAAPLAFDLPDLRSGEAMLTHDAMIVAVTVARRAATNGNADTVVSDPQSQIGLMQEVRCTNAIIGAGGRIEYSPDETQYGNPVDKSVPIVEIQKDGSTSTVHNDASAPGTAAGSC